MHHPSTTPLHRTAFIGGLLLLASFTGCQEQAPTGPGVDTEAVEGVHDPLNGQVDRALAALRQATARYHQIEVAIADGFQQILPCLEHPTEGGLGIPYARLDRFDAEIELTKPEILFYEPRKNGQLRLVGSESVVPIALWNEDEPPTMFGMEFHRNDDHGLYGLHMWTWKHNPEGTFAFWHPSVSCEFAS